VLNMLFLILIALLRNCIFATLGARTNSLFCLKFSCIRSKLRIVAEEVVVCFSYLF